MRIGFNLPQLGPVASAENIARAAEKAEALGYDSVWVTERLLYPVAPRTPYAGTPDGSLPDVYRITLDPLDALTFAAAHTKRVSLGTSVLVMPYYNPVLLARRITTLDVLSGGRSVIGLGQGWSEDEMIATGGSMQRRGARADEFLAVLHTIWKDKLSEFHGEFFDLPRSEILPKPVQHPHPPVYIAAFSPSGLRRVALNADGWIPVGVPVDGMRQMLEGIRTTAKEAGRNPDDVKLVVRANIVISDAPMGENRWVYTGTPDEIKADIRATKDIGAHEIQFDPSFSPAGESMGGFMRTMEQVREMAG